MQAAFDEADAWLQWAWSTLGEQLVMERYGPSLGFTYVNPNQEKVSEEELTDGSYEWVVAPGGSLGCKGGLKLDVFQCPL